MKCTNEQNRKQKDWLDALELRLYGERSGYQKNRGEVLQRRYGFKEPTTPTREAKTDSAISMQEVHKPIIQTNLRRVSKYKPSYHHTF